MIRTPCQNQEWPVMAEFFRGQIDFIYFVYGLGFILLLPICQYLHRRPGSSLPWTWLLLFGTAHGLMEWLDLVALSLGTDPVFDVVRPGLIHPPSSLNK
jgi:hypothetical protein